VLASKKKRLLRLIRCAWIDADEDSGWREYTRDSAWVIYTVGYLVESPKRKTDFLVLANSYLPETGTWSGISRIPKGMIISIETLINKMPPGYKLADTSCNT
jgi:hypothetical protein